MTDLISLHCLSCGGEMISSTGGVIKCSFCGKRFIYEKGQLTYATEEDFGASAEAKSVNAKILQKQSSQVELPQLQADLDHAAKAMAQTAPKPIWKHAIVFSASFLALVFFITAYLLTDNQYPEAMASQPNYLETMVAGGSVSAEQLSQVPSISSLENVSTCGCFCASPFLLIICIFGLINLLRNGIFNKRNADLFRAAVEQYQKLRADLQMGKDIKRF
jgi:hypothetical protein